MPVKHSRDSFNVHGLSHVDHGKHDPSCTLNQSLERKGNVSMTLPGICHNNCTNNAEFIHSAKRVTSEPKGETVKLYSCYKVACRNSVSNSIMAITGATFVVSKTSNNI